jgi:hypothetical protein
MGCCTFMYLVCTCTYLFLLLSPSTQDFKEYGVMQTCWRQMSSNHQQIWILTGVIMKIPAQRINFYFE